MIYQKAPSLKQQSLVSEMCGVLDIPDFPSSAKQFTEKSYEDFIAAHMTEYKAARRASLSYLLNDEQFDRYWRQYI